MEADGMRPAADLTLVRFAQGSLGGLFWEAGVSKNKKASVGMTDAFEVR
jgi:hypothetical protein